MLGNNFLIGNKQNIPKITLEENETLIDRKNIYSDHMFNKEDQYYCQGLYLFTKKEPCFMCSMALVHSRIERIYFQENNYLDGALESMIKLNNYNLNHYFHVFKVYNK
jgi:tRNA-specific adenosine deaminase 3